LCPMSGPWLSAFAVHHPGPGKEAPPATEVDVSSQLVLPISNELFEGVQYFAHRPTHNPSLAAEWPAAELFGSRRRLWEFRIQGQFTRPVTDPLYLAMVLDTYVPMRWATTKVFSILVGICQRLLGLDGKELYQSHGDKPEAKGSQERELPTLATGLVGTDQVIVSDPGSEPDISSDLSGLGTLRTSGISAYRKFVSELDLRPGKVFTFCFWGPSRFLDIVQDAVTAIPGKHISLASMNGGQPFHLSMYTIPAGESKHLSSKKQVVVDFLVGAATTKLSASAVERCRIARAEQVAADDDFVDALETDGLEEVLEGADSGQVLES